MIKNNSKFSPKPTNEPSEEQYMTNKNASGTLSLLGSKRDNTADNSRGREENNLKINKLQATGYASCKLNRFFTSFIGFSLHEAYP